jgi:hypothetical protein
MKQECEDAAIHRNVGRRQDVAGGPKIGVVFVVSSNGLMMHRSTTTGGSERDSSHPVAAGR